MRAHRLNVQFRLGSLVCAICLFASIGVNAQDSTLEVEPDVEPTEPSLVDKMLDSLDQKHEQWSSGLEQSARRVDAFFADDRAFEDANETHGQFTTEVVKVEGEDGQFDLRVRAKIRLPRTQRKVRLLVETDAQELGEDPTVSSSPLTAVEDTKFSVALETFLEQFEPWKIAPAVGIKADWPPDPYARIRAIRYEDVGLWLVRFSSTASWYAVAGPIASASLDFDRTIDAKRLFRVASSIKWEKDEDVGENTEAGVSLALYQRVSERRSFAYSVGASADSDEGWAVHSYEAGISYRQAVYKKWLFGEVNPSVNFQRQYDWDDTWALTLRLEALFGRRYR